MPSSPPTIAFFTVGSFSHITASVQNQLVERFPDYRVERIDIVEQLLKPHRRRETWLNLLPMLRCYGLDYLFRRRRFWSTFYHTPHMFDRIRRFSAESVAAQRNVAFTFQMQSLCDTAVPGVPHFIFTDHTHLANLYYPGFRRQDLLPAFWIALERTIYEHASCVFTMSSHVTRSLREHYGMPADRVVCAYGGPNTPVPDAAASNHHSPSTIHAASPSSVPTDHRSPITDHSGAVAARPVRILFVGVEWERKGGPDLLQAFNRLRARVPNVELVVVGCGPDVAGAANVRIAGIVARDEVARFYRDADIFCVPTRREPFGIVFVEAAHYGLPVVATDIGALPDIVEPGVTGRLVPSGDVSALEAALLDLATDEALRRRLGEAGRQRARRLYTWEHTGERLRQEILARLSEQTEKG